MAQRVSKAPGHVSTAGHTKAWSLDQLAKSEFFHQKLHEWGLLNVAAEVEKINGERLKWTLGALGISRRAWDKVIHRGMKPVIVFAHPTVMESVRGSVGYYRMLSMVSQKSMGRVGLMVSRYEVGTERPSGDKALAIARQLNQIVSRLVDLDEKIDVRELDLWRGMAAGAQAQGSWQNAKGSAVDVLIKGLVRRRLQERGLVRERRAAESELILKDGRIITFADEPDIGMRYEGEVEVAVEIKGGIDAAGVLERFGAALKSLQRTREQNPRSTTVLVLQGISLTPRATRELRIHRQTITDWFTIEEILEQAAKREQFYKLLRI